MPIAARARAHRAIVGRANAQPTAKDAFEAHPNLPEFTPNPGLGIRIDGASVATRLDEFLEAQLICGQLPIPSR